MSNSKVFRITRMSAYFEIKQASGLIGASVQRLNKLATRCGITPSVDGGGRKGSRRHFSVHDIRRLGLAVWLSDAGLRGPAINDVLRRRVSTELLSSLNEGQRKGFLVAVGFRGLKKGYEQVVLVNSLKQAEAALRNTSGVVVPVCEFLAALAARLDSFIKL